MQLHLFFVQKIYNSIVQSNIYSCICQNNSSKSTNCKQYQKSQSKLHRSSKPQRSSIKSSKPAKNFNSSRYCNNHCSTCEICSSIYIQTYCIHVMQIYTKNAYAKIKNMFFIAFFFYLWTISFTSYSALPTMIYCQTSINRYQKNKPTKGIFLSIFLEHAQKSACSQRSNLSFSL